MSYKWKTWIPGDKIASTELNYLLDLRTYPDDTHTAGWGVTQKGRMWWDTTILRYKFWDGSGVQTLPGAGTGASVEYETTATALAAYTPVVAGTNGQLCVVYSSHATDGGVALFGYANAAWRYVELM